MYMYVGGNKKKETKFVWPNIHTHLIVFELYMTEKERKKKKKDEIESFMFHFLNFDKGQ